MTFMMHIMKYKQRIFGHVLFLGIFTILTASMGPSVFAAPLNYMADTSTCPSGEVAVQSGSSTGGQITCCPNGSQSTPMACLFAKYINPFINVLSGAVGLVVVVAVIIGGIEYSSSSGDPQRLASGRRHITNALLGLLAYILLYAFLQFLMPGGFLHG